MNPLPTSPNPFPRSSLDSLMKAAETSTLPLSVGRVLVADLALLPLGVVAHGNEKDERDLCALVRYPALLPKNPATRGGWDLDPLCLASAAWQIDHIMGVRDARAARGEDVQAFDRAINYAHRLVTTVFRDVVQSIDDARRSLEDWFATIGCDLYYFAPRLNDEFAHLEAEPSQLRAIYGACGITPHELSRFCESLARDLGRPTAPRPRVKGAPAPDEHGCRDPEPEWIWGVGQQLYVYFDEGEPLSYDTDLVRRDFLRPLADLWESGALAALPRTAEERPQTELERRIAAA